VICGKALIVILFLFLFACFSLCVWWSPCHCTGEAAVCDALPVRGPPMSVPNGLHPDSGGAVVVQVLLSRPHPRFLHLARDSGRQGLRAGSLGPPGMLRQQPHGSGCGLSAGGLLKRNRSHMITTPSSSFYSCVMPGLIRNKHRFSNNSSVQRASIDAALKHSPALWILDIVIQITYKCNNSLLSPCRSWPTYRWAAVGRQWSVLLWYKRDRTDKTTFPF